MTSARNKKCRLGACSRAGEFITHVTDSNNDMDLKLTTMCVCDRKFDSLRCLCILLENVNRMMGLWTWITPTIFRIPLLSVSTLEKFQASQESSGPKTIRELILINTYHLKGPIIQQIRSFCWVLHKVCLEWFGVVTAKGDRKKEKWPNRWDSEG